MIERNRAVVGENDGAAQFGAVREQVGERLWQQRSKPACEVELNSATRGDARYRRASLRAEFLARVRDKLGDEIVERPLAIERNVDRREIRQLRQSRDKSARGLLGGKRQRNV